MRGQRAGFISHLALRRCDPWRANTNNSDAGTLRQRVRFLRRAMPMCEVMRVLKRYGL